MAGFGSLGFPLKIAGNPGVFLAVSVGTQWETRGKNAWRGLGTKGFAQKKVLSLVLCVAMLLSVMVMGTGAASFTDQDEFSDNYAEAAEVLTGMGIIQGYDDGSFLPQRNINRAQVATMIYRAATGDVTDSKISQFVGEDLFDDVNADDWFAGYVNYCGNAEYIKGFTPDTFGPYKQVTGYQVLAMILRAVGYDENNEYTGDQWTLRVAATSREQGLLDNLNPDTNLAEPATRELVAQLIFEAIQIDTVRYSPAAGAYRPSTTPASSLGEQVFDLDNRNDNDMWGRPSVEWYNTETNDVYATIEEEALATFTVATSECDVATALDVDKTTHVAYWNNGVVADKDYTIDPTVTKDDIGAQGTQIEVYADRIVQIDTYLALVTDVNEATYDDAGHEKTPASSNIQVWGLDKITSGTIDSVAYDDGAYILVNYNQSSDKEVQGFYDVQEAESFVGAQTQIWYNASQHTIDGTTYDDAAHYAKDDADNNTEDFTWFLDQYGNVIGSVAIDRTGYAVLKDIVWNVGTPGYAEATLVYMDGSEATVEVVEFDGITTWGTTAGSWSRWMNDAEPTLEDSTASFPGVSTDTKYNELYEGYALYQVYTYDDGTVKLDGYNVINYDQASMIDTDSHRIVTNTGSIIVDDSTQFLVKNEDNTYTTYTLSTVPSFADSAQIYYTVNEDGIADRVYVKSGIEKAELGDYLYVTTDNYYRIAGTDHYYMSVVIDGADRTIATTQDVVEYLAANEGKVFAVDWTLNPYSQYYGFVDEARLVNEANDISVANGATSEGNVNYLTGNVTFGNGVIVTGEDSYRVNSDTVFVGGDAVSDTVYAEDGIWVAYSSDGQQLVADVVYIGEKLSDDTSATVTAAYNNDTYIIQPDEDNADLYNVETTVGVNSANITVDPTYVNAVVVDAQNAISHPWTSTMNADPATTWSLTIVAEDGVTERDITVSVKEADPTVIDNAVTYIRNGMNNAVLAENVDVYYDIEEAAANAITLTNDNAYTNAKLTIDTTYLTNTDLEIVRFTAGADAVNEDAFNSATATVVSMSGGVSGDIQINDVESGTVVVVALTARDTEISDAGTVYFAFRVVNP